MEIDLRRELATKGRQREELRDGDDGDDGDVATTNKKDRYAMRR